MENNPFVGSSQNLSNSSMNWDNGYITLWDNIGNVFTGNADWHRTQLQNQFNSQEAQKNRDFQERMSSTAYQRAVEDLQNSGLNPYLAMTGGASPASTPSGSSASSSSYSGSSKGLSNLFNTAMKMVSSIMLKSVAKTNFDIAETKYNTAKLYSRF